MGKIQSATVPMLFNVGAVAAQSSGEAELPIVLSAVAATDCGISARVPEKRSG